MVKKITMIEAQKKHAGRYNIYLDGEYEFGVSESVLINFKLMKGMEIDKNMQSDITKSDSVSKAYSKALDYISHQLRAESEVIEKLKKLEVDEATMAEVMAKLYEQNLLNDQKFADSYVRTMAITSDKGPTVIRQNLKAKKIDDNIIENALAEFDNNTLVENATKAAEKSMKHYHRIPEKMRLQKVRVSLMTKGFSTDLINQVLNDMVVETDEEDEWYNLTVQAEKIWQRNRKYDNRTRIMKTKQSLFGKGYQMDDVNRWMEENNY